MLDSKTIVFLVRCNPIGAFVGPARIFFHIADPQCDISAVTRTDQFRWGPAELIDVQDHSAFRSADSSDRAERACEQNRGPGVRSGSLYHLFAICAG